MATATDTAQLHLVQRPFNANGIDRARGEALDVTGWPPRRAQGLVNTRHLVVAAAGFVPKKCRCGRQWASLREATRGHHCDKKE